MMTKPKMAIGLMSGTSMDGIDAALIKTDGEDQITIIEHRHQTYPDEFRSTLKCAIKRVSQIFKHTGSIDSDPFLQEVEESLTDYHIKIVHRLLDTLPLNADNIDLIGFHGQTLLHRPEEGISLQIGNARQLAEATNIDVIYNMRCNDLMNGGQGAPLVPVYHAALAQKLKKQYEFPLVFINIGGIANLTWIDQEGGMVAFDSGPGNCLIDQWIEITDGRAFDPDGDIALSGNYIDEIIEEYRNLSIFRNDSGIFRKRSFDRGDFPILEAGRVTLQDGSASLAFVTAESIMSSCELFPADAKTFILCGGGRKNKAIVAALQQMTAQRGIKLLAAEDVGLQSDFIEAEAWAYLAVRSFYGLPLSYPTTTGCRQAVSGGILQPAK